MITREYSDFVKENGLELQIAGVNGTGLPRHAALDAISLLRYSRIPIIGGEVFIMKGSSITLTHDNWYCQKKDYNNFEEFLEESHNQARAFIAEYVEDPEGVTLYHFVLSG